MNKEGKIGAKSAGRFACDPTKVREASTCGNFRNKLGAYSPDRPHAGQCGACFTFGSLKLAGRFRIGDAYPTDDLWEATNRTEVRTGVGIERKSQGASSGVLYDAEVGGIRVQSLVFGLDGDLEACGEESAAALMRLLDRIWT